jgi:pimeloyl-ACP methyl ester carboxylesterase
VPDRSDDLAVVALTEMVPTAVLGEKLARGDRRLAWVETGEGTPPVVLIAGSGDTSLTWAAVLPLLAGQTRVIAYDRAGLGGSDPDPRLTLDAQIEDLAAIISEVGRGPCVLAGHSWGALLAQLLAFTHPGLVAGLVLADPAQEEILGALPWWYRRLTRFRMGLNLLRARFGRYQRSSRKGLEARAARMTRDEHQRTALVMAFLSSETGRAHLLAARAEERLSSTALPQITELRRTHKPPGIPLVVFSASTGVPERVRVRWTRLQGEVAGAVPGGQHVVVPDAGHYFYRDHPDLFAKAVIDVVERARAGRATE